MSAAAGSRFGPYEILDPIGAGGMGEVYKARDPRLDRTIALKISKAEFTERFTREARTVAQLNHPNICTLHDVGPNYLVMEYVDGIPLKGPLPVEKAVEYAAQILDALDAAHRKGITHRDLKPANILVTKQGIKLLDFGLAKQATGLAPNDVTVQALTTQGQITGTLQYMSPEQLQGKEADARSDLFAFGCVLYEMLSGKQAFTGSSPASIIAAVLEREPAPLITTPPLDRIIRTCLAKDPDQRFQTARDLKRDLVWAMDSVTTAPSQSRLGMTGWIAAGVLALATAALAFAHFRQSPPAQSAVIRFEIGAPEKNTIQKFGVSPDGRTLAFFATGADGSRGLWVRPFGSSEARRIADPGLPNPPEFFWSADSRFILYGYLLGGNRVRLMKADISGGTPEALCELNGFIAGGSVNRDGVVIFGTPAGTWRVPLAGGTAAPLTMLNAARGERAHYDPVFLPDGKRFLYLISSGVADNTGIFVGSLDSLPEAQPRERLLVTNFAVVPVYSADSHASYMLFLRNGALMAQTFDPSKPELKGEPVRIADGVGSFNNFGYFGASSNGVLAYRTGTELGAAVTELTWFDRRETKAAASPPGYYTTPALSSDGNRVAVARLQDVGANGDIWSFDFSRRSFTRLTFGNGNSHNPLWSPDGNFIAYASDRAGGTGFYRKASDGSGAEQELLAPGGKRILDDWSRDGHYLLYTDMDPKTNGDLRILPLALRTDLGADRKPVSYLHTGSRVGEARFSPDSHWVAYTSDESSRSEIYVQPFPATAGGGGKWMISNGGGEVPRWRRDGKELFYVESGRAVMAVDVASGLAFKASVPHRLFGASLTAAVGFTLDVTGDGQKFIGVTIDDIQNSAASPLNIVLNWTSLLKNQDRH
jgi:eukaryotic-like serine/threonine-protein kinase